MNKLSWFLYSADCVDNLRFLLTGPMILLLLCTCIGTMGVFIEEWPKKVPIITGTSGLVLGLLLVFIPSSKTIYAIAASEMGEEVLASPTADKAHKALDAWLDDQIKEHQQKKE